MENERLLRLASGNITKTLLHLCLPSVAAMVVNGLYNMVDTFYVGMLGSVSVMGAMAVVFPIFILQSAFGVGVEIGAGSFISRCLGEKDWRGAGHALAVSWMCSFLTGCVFCAVGLLFMEPILRMLGATEDIMPYAKRYVFWILCDTPFMIASMGLAGTIRAEGNVKLPTIALIFGAVLNIALDPIFIFAMDMGVEGAAIASFISVVFSFTVQLLYYISGKSHVRSIWKGMLPSRILGPVLKIGIPVTIKQMLVAASIALVNILMVPYGEAALGAMGICAKVYLFVMLVLMGFSQGLLPLLAFNLGAGNMGRATAALKKAFFLQGVFILACIAVFFMAGEQIVRLFSNDAEVVRIGGVIMVSYAIALYPEGVQNLMETLFFASAQGKPAFIMSIARQGLVYFPVAFLLSAMFGLTGTIWTTATANLLCCLLIAQPVFISTMRKLKPLSSCEKGGISEANALPGGVSNCKNGEKQV